MIFFVSLHSMKEPQTLSGTHIVFVQTAHRADDDRVYFHQRETLLQAGAKVSIISGKPGFTLPAANHISFDGASMSVKQKQQRIQDELHKLRPDIVICDTPSAVIAASKAKCTLLYDITEWYPSKKNLNGTKGLHRWLRFVLMFFLNLAAGCKAEGLIFGEASKARPFRYIFPRKPHCFIPYYPSLRYVSPAPPTTSLTTCRLFYAGPATTDKGFDTILHVASTCAKRYPHIRFILNTITTTPLPNYLTQQPNLTINITPALPFSDFCQTIRTQDIFLDLRRDDWENTRCMPIKIFYYMACGRPVIYSRLQSIREGIPEIDSFGTLVPPNDTDRICDAVHRYITDNAHYQQHAKQALHLHQEKYNWEQTESTLVSFIAEIQQRRTSDQQAVSERKDR